MKHCARCGRPFQPRILFEKVETRMCQTCFERNLFDASGLPTPPELLDRYTLDPALTESEFESKLNKIRDDEA